MPAGILQIDPPKSVKLIGQVLKTKRELGGNEYLRAPFEMQVGDSTTRIKFKLTRKPKAKDRFVINYVAYIGSESDEDQWFVRRRLELPLAPQAVASPTSPDESDWGAGKLLQIGDKAKPLKLSRADGSKVSLRDFKGEKNVIVTTYRAFW